MADTHIRAPIRASPRCADVISPKVKQYIRADRSPRTYPRKSAQNTAPSRGVPTQARRRGAPLEWGHTPRACMVTRTPESLSAHPRASNQQLNRRRHACSLAPRAHAAPGPSPRASRRLPPPAADKPLAIGRGANMLQGTHLATETNSPSGAISSRYL